MSKWIAKRSVGAYAIEAPVNKLERWLVNTASRQASIWVPKVAIYDAAQINGLAAGMS
ncbi:MAG: heat shock protein HtpX [Pseudohongiellaceae bacterium]|jgi:heat shock protein HtpX